MVAGLDSSEEFDVTGGCDSHARNTASVASMAGTASSGGKRCRAAFHTEGGFRCVDLGRYRNACKSLTAGLRAPENKGEALPLTLSHIAVTVHVACTLLLGGPSCCRVGSGCKVPSKDTINLVIDRAFGCGECQTGECKKSTPQF